MIKQYEGFKLVAVIAKRDGHMLDHPHKQFCTKGKKYPIQDFSISYNYFMINSDCADGHHWEISVDSTPLYFKPVYRVNNKELKNKEQS